MATDAQFLPVYLLKQIALSQGHWMPPAPEKYSTYTPPMHVYPRLPVWERRGSGLPVGKCECGHWGSDHYVLDGTYKGCKLPGCQCFLYAMALGRPKTDSEVPDSLPMQEYRFWIGSAAGTDYCRCRYCGSEFHGEAERYNHTSNITNCTVNLRQIYDVLLREGFCAVCGKYTKAAKWGVPLCDTGNCVARWKTDLTMSDQVEAVKMQLKAAGRLLATYRDKRKCAEDNTSDVG